MDTRNELMRSSDVDSRDLLREMIDTQKRSLRHTRIAAIAAVLMACALLVSLAVVLPRVNAAIDSVEDSVAEVSVFVRNADRFLTENTDAVSQALEKLNEVDLDRLNEAVSNLSDAAAPLAKLSHLFGR